MFIVDRSFSSKLCDVIWAHMFTKSTICNVSEWRLRRKVNYVSKCGDLRFCSLLFYLFLEILFFNFSRNIKFLSYKSSEQKLNFLLEWTFNTCKKTRKRWKGRKWESLHDPRNSYKRENRIRIIGKIMIQCSPLNWITDSWNSRLL